MVNIDDSPSSNISESPTMSNNGERLEDEDVTAFLNDVAPDIVSQTSDIDADTAKHMSKLSIQDREKILHDIHGVSDEVEETPELVQASLARLESKLRKLTGKQAYDSAKEMDSGFVSNRDFRLKFLRADRFDANQAALRIARHFQAKLELFGPELLVSKIRQRDLDTESSNVLNFGYPQILPLKDMTGRSVCVWFPGPRIDAMSLDAKLRVLFYTLSVLSEDITTQKRGVVNITYSMIRDRSSYIDHNEVWKITSLQSKALPIRIEGQHFCYDSSLRLIPTLSVMKAAASIFLRLRMRTHNCTQTECKSRLKTFGIPTSLIPSISDDGDVTHDENIERWRIRNDHEKLAESKDQVVVPGPFDILLGRGRRNLGHSGNIMFRNLVEDSKHAYFGAASREDKFRLKQEIFDIVRCVSGRFLKMEDGGWIEVDDEIVHLKVSHLFRDLEKRGQSESNLVS